MKNLFLALISKKTRSVGIEPTAHGFGDHCSTDELRPLTFLY